METGTKSHFLGLFLELLLVIICQVNVPKLLLENAFGVPCLQTDGPPCIRSIAEPALYPLANSNHTPFAHLEIASLPSLAIGLLGRPGDGSIQMWALAVGAESDGVAEPEGPATILGRPVWQSPWPFW